MLPMLPLPPGQTPTQRQAVPPMALSRRAWGLAAMALAAGSLSQAVRATPASPASPASPVLPAASNAAAADHEAAFWALLAEGGCVVLVHHALTEPGLRDPPEPDLRRCDTQLNLSAAGQAQARHLGARLVEHQVKLADVRSSAFCRCKDTARLAFGRVRVWSPLNPLPESAGQASAQTADTARLIQAHRASRNLVLVTHQANIQALTGVLTAMGEMLLVRPLASTTDRPIRYPVLASLQTPAA